MLWKFIIVVAFLGMLKVSLASLFEWLKPILSAVLSVFILGIVLGVILAGIMIIGEFLCIFDDMYILGYHPFKVGFIIGTGWSVLSSLIDFFRR